MTFHEFGTDNEKTVVLIHPSLVMWDYFEYVIPLMKDRLHLISPALPGYDKEQKSDFTSVERIASELEDWLIDHGHRGSPASMAARWVVQLLPGCLRTTVCVPAMP